MTILIVLYSELIFQVVLPDAPRVPFFLIAIVLVSVAILNTALVMRLFQVSDFLS